MSETSSSETTAGEGGPGDGPGGSGPGEPQAGAGRRSIWNLLRPVLAVLILGWVLTTVPWRDELVWSEDGRDSVAVTGTLHGDWRGQSVDFELDADVTPAPDWPEPLVVAAREGRLVSAVRRPPDATRGFEWRPGMPRVFSELDLSGLGPAVLLILIGLACVAARWQRLLILAGCPARYRDSFRLTYLGLFFNLVMPGLTGGDVVKAVLVVREHPERRADALVSVIVDRAIGLSVLVGLAAVAVMIAGDVFADLRLFVVAGFAALVLGLWVALHPFARRLFRTDAILDRLPFGDRLKKVDRALQEYSRQPATLLGAVALTVVNHGCIAGSIWFLAGAYGSALSYLEALGISAIANTVSALPLSPAGWGVGEAAFRELFLLIGADPTIGVAVSITFRLIFMVFGLAGGLFLLLPSGRDVRASIDSAQTAPDA